MLVSAVSMNQNSGVNFGMNRETLLKKAKQLGANISGSETKREIEASIATVVSEHGSEGKAQYANIQRSRAAKATRQAEKAEAARITEETRRAEAEEAARPKTLLDKVLDNKYVSATLDALGKMADDHKAGKGY